MDQDVHFMQLALDAARQGRYHTYRNPMVGAVIVKNGQVLATGYHHYYGGVHAERDAISKLTPEQLFNSTLYVSLEPCVHYGKQPPCSQLVINSKIKRVVIAELDPHHLVTGKGVAELNQAGIEVKVGLLAAEAAQINEHYQYFYQKQRPYVCLKQAISLDDKVAAQAGQRTAITNDQAYQLVHRERADFQAIMVGSNTALIDDPSLLTTVKQEHPPVRIVVDRRGRLRQHPQLRLFQEDTAPVWLLTQNPDCLQANWPKHVSVFLLKDGNAAEIVKFCAQKEIQSIYLEGGPKLAAAFLNAGLVNRVISYLAPTYLGENGVAAADSQQGLKLKDVDYQLLGDNIRISGRL